MENFTFHDDKNDSISDLKNYATPEDVRTNYLKDHKKHANATALHNFSTNGVMCENGKKS